MRPGRTILKPQVDVALLRFPGRRILIRIRYNTAPGGIRRRQPQINGTVTEIVCIISISIIFRCIEIPHQIHFMVGRSGHFDFAAGLCFRLHIHIDSTAESPQCQESPFCILRRNNIDIPIQGEDIIQ